MGKITAAEAAMKAAQTAMKAARGDLKVAKAAAAFRTAGKTIDEAKTFTAGMKTFPGDGPMTQRGVLQHFRKAAASLDDLQKFDPKHALLKPKLGAPTAELIKALDTTPVGNKLRAVQEKAAMFVTNDAKLTRGEFGALSRAAVRAESRAQAAPATAGWGAKPTQAVASNDWVPTFGVEGRPYEVMTRPGARPGTIEWRPMNAAERESTNAAYAADADYHRRLEQGLVTTAEEMFRKYGGL